ncbi:MAG: hypothetical protein P0111_14290 [Nitrospira sp.]|nr:hypothetical protein [Nitrospira sp.]
MKILTIVSALICFWLLLATAGQAEVSTTWIDELTNSVSFYKSNYPASNWEPYLGKLAVVKDALGRGDQAMVRKEMGRWFKMLRNHEYGIHDVAADELYNFALIVTPIQEFNIAVPTGGGGGF